MNSTSTSTSTPSETMMAFEEAKGKQDKFLTKVRRHILKEYGHWYAILDIKQYYIGRLFLYAKRYEATDMTVLTSDEREELWDIILPEIKEVYAQTFEPDKLNFAFLGNDEEHCHLHVVPRYKTEKVITFEGIEFVDRNYGHNYARPDASAFQLEDSIIDAIYNKLKAHFSP